MASFQKPGDMASKRSREDLSASDAKSGVQIDQAHQTQPILAQAEEPQTKRLKSGIGAEGVVAADTLSTSVPIVDGAMDLDEAHTAAPPEKASKSQSPTKRTNRKDKGKGKRSGGLGDGSTRPRGGGKAIWGPRPSQTRPTLSGEEDIGTVEKDTRYPKRKVALLMSYCGTGCSGMQFQDKGIRTIEGLLWDALIKAGAVSKDNAEHPSKVNLQRAARTDAGVHAAGNLISLKMITAPPIEEPSSPAGPLLENDTSLTARERDGAAIRLHTPTSIIAHINTLLPPQIRLWSFVRTKNSFHARTECDSRIYEYLFPSWLLLPPRPGSSLGDMLNATREGASQPPNSSFWDGVGPVEKAVQSTPDGKEVFASDLARKRAWRVPTETLNSLRELVKQYEGTHCYHNYTVGRDFSDRAAKRFMMKLEVRDPQIYDGTEWISVQFHGQSFMLHQRKMMSMAILCCRTGTPSQLIPETFGPKKITIPKAPSLGLLLEKPIFGSYNNHVAKSNARLEEQASLSPEERENQFRDPIDYELFREEIDKFKVEFIYERMRAEEANLNIFDRWVAHIDSYGGSSLHYLNSRGKISDTAVIKKGETRQDTFKEWGLEKVADSVGGITEEDDEEEVKGMKGKQLEEMEG